MKALLFSLGSRGDIEPFLALGEVLRRNGWCVIMVFPEQFRSMAETEGFSFHGLNKDFLEILMESPEAKLIMGGEGSFLKRFRAIRHIRNASKDINKDIVKKQIAVIEEEAPDYILYHQKCMVPPIWGINNPGRSVMISPLPCLLHPSPDHSVIGLKGGGEYGAVINKWSYTLPNFIRSLVMHFSVKPHYQKLNSKKTGPIRIMRRLLKDEKSLYTISKTLYNRPKTWPDTAQVVGFYDRSKVKNWEPDSQLVNFISEHEKIVFISFGSISNPNPKAKTKIILDVLTKHNIPAIINTSWGGLQEPKEYAEQVLFVNNVPYDWIFPKMYACVHHGGSGTTHSSLKYGCATLIIPHFIDQFYWNDRIEAIGAGPKGISIKKLNLKDFENSFTDLWNNKEYKEKAEAISKIMNDEIDEEALMKYILK